MSKLEMQQCVLGQVFTNCYFLKNKETGELLIVDPGDGQRNERAGNSLLDKNMLCISEDKDAEDSDSTEADAEESADSTEKDADSESK